ncbi:MAG: M61 family metallopeptidase [Sphingopyxis sp.]
MAQIGSGRMWMVMGRVLPVLALLAMAPPAFGEEQGAAAANRQQSRPDAPSPISNAAYPGIMQLDVDATDVAHAIYSVRQTIPVQGGGRLTLRYPEWLPGKHAPRGAVGDMAGLVFTANGRTLTWRRDAMDVFAFQVDVPAGARVVEARFQFLSPTQPSEGRVVITDSLLNLQWEQVSLYPAGYATRGIRVQPSVTLPAGWTGVAALDGAQVSGNRVRYAPTDYETLVDSPMFAGAYFRRWDLGHNVALNVVADAPEFLAAAPEHIAAHAALVDEAVLLFGARHFDRYEFLLALSADLGGIGLEHHRSSENSRETDYFTEWATNGSERGLLPHELTHSWNGKFRRPARLWTADYATRMDDRLLWVYEGQTSYWDLVLAARSGMQSREMVLGEWARYAATYQIQPGRAWRSVEDTTLDPIMAARRSRPFPSATRTEDYYNEGSLIWLEADMLIRQQSGGRKNLDDFARAFFGMRDGDWGTLTYDFDDVVSALNAIAPYDWAGFFRTRVMEPGAPAPLAGFERGGYRLVFHETPNAFDAERAREGKMLDLTFSLGMVVDKAGEVTSVLYDGPIFDEGVTNGTRILAVNGMAYSEDRMKAAVTLARDGRTPITLLVQRGDRYRTITPNWTGGLRYPHLERVGAEPALIDQLLAARRPVTQIPSQ